MIKPLSAAAAGIILLLFPASLTWAQHTEIHPSPAVARGRQQFQQTCAFCHGTNASGSAEGPSLILSALVRHDREGELIGPVVREGRTSKGMPSFSIPRAQIEDIAAFLHDCIHAADVRSATGHGSFTLKQLLTGNAQAGKRLFDGAGRCSVCHSPAKDLAHIANRLTPVELQARLLYPAAESRPTVTVTSRSGGKISGELLSLDAFNVALKDSDGWYHSSSLNSVTIQVHDPLQAHLAFLSRCSNTDMHNLFAYLETLQ